MTSISLGAGAQSSAMMRMALEGRFGDMPDCAIFADTQWEPKAVYEWLERLEREVAPFPIYRVSAGDLRRDAVDGTGTNKTLGCSRVAALPYYTKGVNESSGMAMRHCSEDYKLTPMQRKWRELGATAKNPIECWIGISLDEAHRMKPSRVKYATNRFPLVENRLRREDCQNYLTERMGSAAPKSACIGCPFHGDDYWAQLKAESPAEFQEAIAFDEAIRSHPSMRAERYLHRKRIPLRNIDEFLHENQGRMFVDGFGNECEGMCGT